MRKIWSISALLILLTVVAFAQSPSMPPTVGPGGPSLGGAATVTPGGVKPAEPVQSPSQPEQPSQPPIGAGPSTETQPSGTVTEMQPTETTPTSSDNAIPPGTGASPVIPPRPSGTMEPTGSGGTESNRPLGTGDTGSVETYGTSGTEEEQFGGTGGAYGGGEIPRAGMDFTWVTLIGGALMTGSILLRKRSAK